MTLIVTVPIDITTADIVSHNVPLEGGINAWDVNQNYALDAIVYDPNTLLTYASVKADNLGNDPANDVQYDDRNLPTNWSVTGVLNRGRMFSYLRDEKTTYAGDITFSLAFTDKSINSIGFLGMDGIEAVEFDIVYNGDVVYSVSESIITKNATDFYEWYFDEFTTKSNLAYFDLPILSDFQVNVRLVSSSTAEIGRVVLGYKYKIGKMTYGARAGERNFSTVKRLSDGTSVLKRGRKLPTLQCEVTIDKSNVSNAYRLRDRLQGDVPALWQGIEDNEDGYYDPLLISGFYTKFEIDIKHPTVAIGYIDLEEF